MKTGARVNTAANVVELMRAAPADAYRMQPLVELVRMIVVQRDQLALHELHNHRRPFRSAKGGHIRLVEYVDELRDLRSHRQRPPLNAVILDRAYDLTIDKFSRLPAEPSSADQLPQLRKGTDCTCYYAAILQHFSVQAQTPSCLGELQREVLIARLLQGLVSRHFDLSCLEQARRVAGPIKRYIWQIGGGAIYVWLPTSMTGRECQRWLEENIDEPDPTRARERDRVQAIINARLVLPRLLLSDNLGDSPGDTPRNFMIPWWATVRGGSPEELADVVAKEKEDNIHLQRPAIQRLGRQGLRSLIHRIFADLSDGTYDAKTVASNFGLSPATLSRFAGSRWNTRTNGSLGVPDLFLNMAHTLAEIPDFVQAARAAGVWPSIEAIRRLHRKAKGTSHGE